MAKTDVLFSKTNKKSPIPYSKTHLLRSLPTTHPIWLKYLGQNISINSRVATLQRIAVRIITFSDCTASSKPLFVRISQDKYLILLWVHGIVVLNVECKFRGRSTNPSECHNHVMLILSRSTLPQPNGGLLLDQQCGIEEVSINYVAYNINCNRYLKRINTVLINPSNLILNLRSS